jgi:hypothetical protein
MSARVAFIVAAALLAAPASAPAAAPWKAVGKVSARGAAIAPRAYTGFALDRAALGAQLAKAPRERTQAARRSTATVAIPAPNGSIQRFLVQDSPIMEPGLAAKHPNIRTYSVLGVTDRSATGRIDLTPLGFHAVIRSARGTWYVDPRFAGDDRTHVSYFGRDLPDSGGRFRGERTAPRRAAPQPKGGRPARRAPGNVSLRTYRLALLNNPDYATYFGGTDNAVLAAKVILMNRVNQIYNDDFAVRMLLIDGSNRLNFDTDAEMTDPDGPCGTSPCYPDELPNLGDIFGPASEFCGVGTLISNDVVLANVIGAENYDIGHIALGNDGGGIAGLGVVGNLYKAEGCTGLPTPDGDLYAVDYVAHEMGHQFGGNHTFQGTTDPFTNNNCYGDPSAGGFGNRNTPTSVEPGSGSSIMAYAGICRTDDLQPHSDPYFSQRSIDEETEYTSGDLQVNEQQLFTFTDFDTDGDSLTLNYNGVNSAPIVRGTNYDAAGIEAALHTIPALAGVDIDVLPFFQDFFDPNAIPEPDDLGFVIDFTPGSLAETDVAQITLTNVTGLSGTATEITKGGQGGNGGEAVPTANDAPQVSAGADHTIPARTPFTLSGSATDAQSDPLVYLWEQNDAGTENPINLINNAKVDGPLFRVFGEAAEVSDEGTLLFNSPGENIATADDATRSFPDGAQVASDNTNASTGACPEVTITPTSRAGDIDPAVRDCYSEFLPTADYAPAALHFRLTARDRRGTGGGVGHDDVTLTLAKGAGPFRVTNNQTGADPGGPLTVTWDVAGTNAAPVSTANVNISLSYDGGVTFPTVLAASTPNDGSETVTIPVSAATTIARVKVAAVGNVFFDVSHTDINIQPGAGPTPTATPSPEPTYEVPTPTPTPYYSVTGYVRPDLTKVRRQLKLDRRGRVALRLRCKKVGTGTVTSRCRGVARIKRQGRVIGRKAFNFSRFRTQTVKVRIGPKARRALRRHALKATVAVRVRNPGGLSRLRTKRVTLKRIR